jgi:hydroxymethylglutaryl-CoA reductase (NADPH)
MGMNMVTIATQALCEFIEQETGFTCVTVAGNFDIDKKPAWLNFIEGRGIKVWAEAILSPEIIKDVLKTTPQKIFDVWYGKCVLGSIMSGSMGFNAHFANIIAAIFIATGQDPAHIVEGSIGVTTTKVLPDGNLYVSVYLPDLMIGTIGGGTKLKTQKEALAIIGAKNVLEFGEVIGAAVLAGEISLLASLAERTLAGAHKKLGR